MDCHSRWPGDDLKLNARRRKAEKLGEPMEQVGKAHRKGKFGLKADVGCRF